MDRGRTRRSAASFGQPALLIALHDVSPLTLDCCRRALALIDSAGVPRHALTLLVIPRHEDRVSIHEHAPTLDWIRALTAEGATVVTHGYTHRMTGRCFSPAGLLWAHAFARGQGELFRSDHADASQRIATAKELMFRAGFEDALRGFVPPAWLLSAGAQSAVAEAGFAFYEVLGAIVHGGLKRAQRVIGFGALSAIEASATALYSSWQLRLPAVDTRLAIHPADLERPTCTRAAERALRRLLEVCVPMSYSSFLGLEH